MMTMMTMILTTWMDRDRIQHPEGLMTVTMQIQAIPRKVAKARTVARRILDADNTNSIEQLVAAASPATSNSAPPPWRALVQRAQQVPDHTAITAPFLFAYPRQGRYGRYGRAKRW
jgi:hypothetical protein